jgi:hypothetical protein
LNPIIGSELFPTYTKLTSQWASLEFRKCNMEQDLRRLMELCNEISIANIILSDQIAQCRLLEYEIPLSNGGTTIDYLIHYDSYRLFCDVKTIHPQSIDSWESYVKFVDKDYFPEKVTVDLQKEYMGGEIWHDMSASRSHMLDYSIEYEKKISKCGDYTKTLFMLTFCGNGYDWSLDELEDFADFYHTGVHNSDDPFAKAEFFNMQQKGIRLERNINYFCYHERPNSDIHYTNFIPDVRTQITKI